MNTCKHGKTRNEPCPACEAADKAEHEQSVYDQLLPLNAMEREALRRFSAGETTAAITVKRVELDLTTFQEYFGRMLDQLEQTETERDRYKAALEKIRAITPYGMYHEIIDKSLEGADTQ